MAGFSDNLSNYPPGVSGNEPEIAGHEPVTVTISGKAWRAQPIGADPCYTPDDPDFAAMKATAKVRSHGKGSRVTLTADPDTLLHFAYTLETEAGILADCCDGSASQRSEASECRKAAAKIRKACGEPLEE